MNTAGSILRSSEEMGIHFLRYGVPLHRIRTAPGKFDWEFSDLAFGELKRKNIAPIADLCHFGIPDWLGNFQNPDFPDMFADYALAFGRRYPAAIAHLVSDDAKSVQGAALRIDGGRLSRL